MIYEWSGASTYAQYVGKTQEDDRKVRWYDALLGDPLPRLPDWDAPVLKQYLGDGKRKRKPRPMGDCSRSTMVMLISGRAEKALSDIWERHALLYPVILEDDPDMPYYMVVITTELDCLDREKSEGKLQKYGPTPDLFSVINNWVFDVDCVSDNDLFVIPDSKTTAYVSERFKQRVIDAGLKGFCLKREFWEEKPFIS